MQRPDPLDILRRALLQPGDAAALAAVLNNREAILDAIDEEDCELDEWIDFEVEWLAVIARVLDGTAIRAESRLQSALAAMWIADEESIGRTFADYVVSLPVPLRTFDGIAVLPRVDPETRDSLMQTPSVAAAHWVGDLLADYGLTPMSFEYARQAIRRVIECRWLEEDRVEEEAPLLRAVVTEIMALAQCRREAAQFLLGWLMHASEFDAYVVRGLRIQKTGGGIEFTPLAGLETSEKRLDRSLLKLPAPVRSFDPNDSGSSAPA